MTAEDIIKTLNMIPHPEGGHYAEVFRDPHLIDGRHASSVIYYLLRAGERSHWHRVDAVEIWHYYAGTPLKLSLSDGGKVEVITLGPDLLTGQRPQGVVPRDIWQSAEVTTRTGGEWTLVGCTVAPAFEFAGFEMAPKDWSPSGA